LPPITPPTSPSKLAETSRWPGGVRGAVHRDVPPWTTWPPGRPGDGLRQQPMSDRRRPWVYDDSGGADHATAQSHARMQCLCGLRIKQLQTGPAPRHRAADTQRQAWLDELAEARRQLDKEMSLLHQELCMDAEPCDRRPAKDIPVQEEPRDGNGDRRECRSVADQLHGRAPTPPARGPARDNNRCANEGRTSTPTPTLTLCRSSGGRRRTSPLWPCYCAAARRQRPPRNDEYANN
jgi:hypothetical protein